MTLPAANALMVVVVVLAAGARDAAAKVPRVSDYGYSITGTERFMKDKWKSPIINHEHKLIVCSIPKCGSTSLRQLMRVLIPNSGTWKNRDETHYWIANKGVHLSDYTPEKATEIMNDPEYRKVAVIRHPVERLLSGYVDKIIKSKYGERFYKVVNMSFPDFVDRVYHEKPSGCGLNEHWQNLTCFCGLDYLSHMYEIYMLGDSPELIHDLVDSGVLPMAKVEGGFGKRGDESLFRFMETGRAQKLGSMHNTEDKIKHMYTKEMHAKIIRRYEKDFRILGMMNPDQYAEATMNNV